MMKSPVANVVTGLFLLFCHVQSWAEEAPLRWFEVEVILFTRTAPETMKEEFPQQVKPIQFRRTRDLLTPYHYPDISHIAQPDYVCDISQVIKPQFDEVVQKLEWPLDVEIAPPPVALESLQVKNIDIFSPMPDLFKPQPFADFITDRPDCLSSPWISFEGMTENNLNIHYDIYPRVIEAGELEADPYVHLMSPASFQLTDIYRTLRRQPDIRPILHVGWRQPGVAAKQSRATRLYAGIDYSREFDFQGRPIIEDKKRIQPSDEIESEQTPPLTTVENIERLLTMVDQGAKINYRDNTIGPQQTAKAVTDPEEVREIDGLFRIYIDPFNYLHINAEFNVRQLEAAPQQALEQDLKTLLAQLASQPQNQPQQQAQQTIATDNINMVLRNYHFKQTRRVITKQLHYFDHPHMGMIVQIRRYGW